jgi:transcriptional regulator with XRE-family HTH domain
MVDYAKAIRRARMWHEISQDDLGRKSALSESYVSMLETGRRSPSTEAIEQIAAALKMPVWALIVLGSEDAPNVVRMAAMAEFVK